MTKTQAQELSASADCELQTEQRTLIPTSQNTMKNKKAEVIKRIQKNTTDTTEHNPCVVQLQLTEKKGNKQQR